MDRLQLKQLQRLRKIKQQKNKQQMNVVRRMLQDDKVKTVFDYCKKILVEPPTQSLSDYSPSHISKFLFDQQLQKAKIFFQSLPQNQCTIQHFLLLMISLLKFPFQKWPMYLVGVKDMFNQILEEKAHTITYQNFFKYAIGQVLDFKEQAQNTEFQVRFQELKKQDYLLHDNGVKKFYYSTEAKCFMTLDQSSPAIKFYNKQMRIISKFSANKQKHNKKYPNILHFDYNQIRSKLGITLQDNTFSIINLHNFLNKSKFEFEMNGNNQIVISFQEKMLQVYYIQMLNRWALISEMNKLYILDVEKYKQNDPHFLVEIKFQNPDLKIKYVLQLVNLSMICVVMGNQVNFFNQNFSQFKHAKFTHGNDIKIFRYCEQLGVFYLCGDQRFITMITLVKNSDSFILDTFDTQSKYQISTFDIFPYIGTIVSVDTNNQVRLFNISQGTCYQVANYSNITKKQHDEIKMIKISKTQFALYETYTLVFNQQKIAIEKDTQFSFLNRSYYDEVKQQFYFSVNNQIISFSVFQGQIRKSYNLQTANVPKHESFIIGKETSLFIIDHQKNIYEAYLKDKVPDGENKNYKKKIGINHVIDMFYDQQIRHAFIVGPTTIHTIRNDKMNNFTVTSVLNIQNFPDIIEAKYNVRQKYIIALTNNQKWIIIDAQTYKLLFYYDYHFPVSPNDHQDIILEHFQQDEQYNIDIILNNRNQIYLISREQPMKRMIVKIHDHLPYKLRSLEFKNMKYCQVSKNKKYLLLNDNSGYLLQLNIANMLSKNFKQTEVSTKFFRFPVKDVHKLQQHREKATSVVVTELINVVIQKKDFLLFKGHDRQIKILAKINLQGIRTLTISCDGHIKLWQGQQLLFHLRLPDLKRITWNMNSVQKIKNQRSVNQVMKILNRISELRLQRASPQILIQKNSKVKASEQLKQIRRFNINDPIQIQIDNKEIQQIVTKTQNINWNSFRIQNKRRQLNIFQRVTHHPWRTKNQFRKIMQKASPENKYQTKMPSELVSLRNSLDMKDRASRLMRQYQSQLIILPELNSYVSQTKKYSLKDKQPTQNQQNENEQAFESCLYIKRKKQQRKINQFDEIDKQFKKKWLALTGKKWIPKSQGKKKKQVDISSSRKPKDQKVFYAPVNMVKYDPINEVKSLFENNNREAAATRKGRIIKIPDIKLKRQDLFNND